MSAKTISKIYPEVKPQMKMHLKLTPNQRMLKQHIEDNPTFLTEFNLFFKTIKSMVYSVAKQLSNNNRELCEDLFQEGVIGAMLGYLKFDPTKNTKASSYCYFWIKQQMQTYLNQKASTITVSHYARNKINKARKNWNNLNPVEKAAIHDIEAKFNLSSIDSEELDFCF
jgi:RNA polymerase sigma factor (sigma-70 family)